MSRQAGILLTGLFLIVFWSTVLYLLNQLLA
jgi:hypothetical protein